MEQTRREHRAESLLLAASVIPAMIATGFMPSWDVLPPWGSLAIATVGSGIAGALATPLRLRGIAAGVVAGTGIFAGIWLYVLARQGVWDHPKVSKPELVLGALLGWAPGLILYSTWARPKPRLGKL